MTRPRELDPAESPRALYGSELRRLREEAGLSQDRLGEKVFCSGAYIGQLEAAVRKPQLDMSKQLDVIFGTGGLLTRICRLANHSRHADYFEAAADLEARAKAIYEFAPALVPGVLQIEPYVRAFILAAQPTISDEALRTLVSARLERSRLLDDETRPLLWTILDENVLRRPIGGRTVMAAQLLHIAELVEKRRIIVQVLPYSAGAHALLGGMMTIMTFDDAPPVAYMEGAHAGQLLDDPAVLAECQMSYDLARAAALSTEASLSLLRSVAEEYSK